MIGRRLGRLLDITRVLLLHGVNQLSKRRALRIDSSWDRWHRP